MREFFRSLGRIAGSPSQKARLSLAVQVLIGSPLRPWTATMLKFADVNDGSENSYHIGYVLNDWIIASIDFI